MRFYKKKRQIKSWDDILFDFVSAAFLVFMVIITLYPIYYVVIASFSDPIYANTGEILLYPKGFTVLGYQKVLQDQRIWTGYFNTIIYTVGGTMIGVVAVILSGYALADKELPGTSLIMKLLVFTMYFSGGMIPLFLVVNGLGLVNTRFIIMVLGSVSAYNIIVVRSFMMNNVPLELKDAATIDGCGEVGFFVKVVLPLSKAIIAVMVLYIAVGHWNSYFYAMIYLTDKAKFPLQLYLRQMLLTASALGNDISMLQGDPEAAEQMQTMAQVLKYSIIVVATAPILCVYPFIQKYFVKGVMIGSVKG